MVAGGDVEACGELSDGVFAGWAVWVWSFVSVVAGVRVVVEGADGRLNGVFEGAVHLSSVASVAAVGDSVCAVENVLLGEWGECEVVLDGPSAFHGSDGGEGPAGAALSLILNGGDGASLNPGEL